jgi:hypothetical protein
MTDAHVGAIQATVHLVSSDKDKSSVFKVKNVIVKVDTLKFAIRDSKHDLLYKTLKPLATGLVKKQIQKAVKSSITTGMEYVDGQLVGVRDRMASAKATEGESRSKVLQDVRLSPRSSRGFANPPTDVHKEEGRGFCAVYDFQREELAVQGRA